MDESKSTGHLIGFIPPVTVRRVNGKMVVSVKYEAQNQWLVYTLEDGSKVRVSEQQLIAMGEWPDEN